MVANLETTWALDGQGRPASTEGDGRPFRLHLWMLDCGPHPCRVMVEQRLHRDWDQAHSRGRGQTPGCDWVDGGERCSDRLQTHDNWPDPQLAPQIHFRWTDLAENVYAGWWYPQFFICFSKRCLCERGIGLCSAQLIINVARSLHTQLDSHHPPVLPESWAVRQFRLVVTAQESNT